VLAEWRGMKRRGPVEPEVHAEGLIDRLRAHVDGRPPLPAVYNELTGSVIGAAMHVHSSLGPGLLEKFYERAMHVELRYRGIPFQTQVPISVTHREVNIGDSFLDLVVDELLVVELKASESISPLHRMQVHSYLRAGHFALGLIINFNVAHLREGLARIIDSRRT
jgi:GxxExxY protein